MIVASSTSLYMNQNPNATPMRNALFVFSLGPAAR